MVASSAGMPPSLGFRHKIYTLKDGVAEACSNRGCLGCALQAVDTAHHSWANYFLAAYKVRDHGFRLVCRKP